MQCTRQKWNRCAEHFHQGSYSSAYSSLPLRPTGILIEFLGAQTVTLSKEMSLSLYHKKQCSIKSSAFPILSSIYVCHVSKCNDHSFLGIKAPKKSPVICLMHAWLLKADPLKSKNLMDMLILYSFLFPVLLWILITDLWKLWSPFICVSQKHGGLKNEWKPSEFLHILKIWKIKYHKMYQIMKTCIIYI